MIDVISQTAVLCALLLSAQSHFEASVLTMLLEPGRGAEIQGDAL